MSGERPVSRQALAGPVECNVSANTCPIALEIQTLNRLPPDRLLRLPLFLVQFSQLPSKLRVNSASPPPRPHASPRTTPSSTTRQGT